MQPLKGRIVSVTGANSMVGRAVMTELLNQRAIVHQINHTGWIDLLNYSTVLALLNKSDYVVHCAGYNGNIAFNAKYPADIFYRTTQLALNVLRASQELGIQKVISPLASCAYPDIDILNEAEFWDGKPNDSVEAHGLAKRNILAYSRQLFKQYGFISTSVVFNTCYGPYDSYDENKTKVVGGMIKRFVDAKIKNLPSVTCWGSGKVRRELIYVDDAAKAMVDILINNDEVNVPINVGTNKDISILELANLVAEAVGYDGEILWDISKPDGQYRKLLAADYILDATPLEIGLTKTIDWYKKYLKG